MPRPVAVDYFSVGDWAPGGPLRLRRLTCTQCGRAQVSWVAFRAHRKHCEGVLGREAVG
jgi:hypothetical protein